MPGSVHKSGQGIGPGGKPLGNAERRKESGGSSEDSAGGGWWAGMLGASALTTVSSLRGGPGRLGRRGEEDSVTASDLQ